MSDLGLIILAVTFVLCALTSLAMIVAGLARRRPDGIAARLAGSIQRTMQRLDSASKPFRAGAALAGERLVRFARWAQGFDDTLAEGTGATAGAVPERSTTSVARTAPRVPWYVWAVFAVGGFAVLEATLAILAASGIVEWAVLALPVLLLAIIPISGFLLFLGALGG